jgi:hypothetical protein
MSINLDPRSLSTVYAQLHYDPSSLGLFKLVRLYLLSRDVTLNPHGRLVSSGVIPMYSSLAGTKMGWT